MSDLIDRQAVLDALSNAVPSLTTPDGCGQFDRELQIVGEALVDAMQIVHALPTASPWRRVEDELPVEVGSYLVYAPTYIGGSSSAKECKAGVMFARWLKGGHWSIEVGYYKRPGCVTHWMPIEPPKEDE